MKKIVFPGSNNQDKISIDIDKNLIIVGANGSGKTRLGCWIETMNDNSKRISSQRSLRLVDGVQMQDPKTAREQLKNSYKNQSPVQPQNDFEAVLTYLFAEEARRNQDIAKQIDSGVVMSKGNKPFSVKEKVIDVWGFVFDYRSLTLDDYSVKADDFSGSEMSDGEKACFYLIAQVLLADKSCLLIIDEPELHLHKSLNVRLWKKLEECRNDCTFIYITHDVDFAVNKIADKILWINKFTYHHVFAMQGVAGGEWEWQEIDTNKTIPEDLYLKILGSRAPILFVEGDSGSLDIKLYQAYYENFTVIPLDSCEKVIDAVKSFKGNTKLHRNDVFGLIDKDFRDDGYLNDLEREHKIFHNTLYKVENLFLLPKVIDLVCKHLSKEDKIKDIEKEIISNFTKFKDSLSLARLKDMRTRHLNKKIGSVKTDDDWDNFKETILSELDNISVDMSTNDIVEILKFYKYKGILNTVGGIVGLGKKDEYSNLVANLLTSDKKQDLMNALGEYLPNITID